MLYATGDVIATTYGLGLELDAGVVVLTLDGERVAAPSEANERAKSLLATVRANADMSLVRSTT